MTAKNICYVAMATALIAVCSWLCIPIGTTTLTLQILAVFFLSGVLGVKRATLAVTAYLILGAVGVPVFAGFTGGIGKFFSPVGGYLFSFLFIAPFCSWLCEKWGKTSFWKNAAVFLLGLAFAYAAVTVWVVILSGMEGAPIALGAAVAVWVLPYLPLDICKVFVAAFLVGKLRGKI